MYTKKIWEWTKTIVTILGISWLAIILASTLAGRVSMDYQMYQAKKTTKKYITTEFQTDEFTLEKSGWSPPFQNYSIPAEAFFAAKIEEKNYFVSLKREKQQPWKVVSIEPR